MDTSMQQRNLMVGIINIHLLVTMLDGSAQTLREQQTIYGFFQFLQRYLALQT